MEDRPRITRANYPIKFSVSTGDGPTCWHCERAWDQILQPVGGRDCENYEYQHREQRELVVQRAQKKPKTIGTKVTTTSQRDEEGSSPPSR